MKEFVSRCINQSIRALFDPYGVGLTFIAAVAIHIYATSSGQVHGFFPHYVLFLSEWAIVVGGMVGHSALLSGKASSIKNDVVIHALPGADNRFAGIEELSESELDALAQHIKDIQGGLS